MNPKTILPVLLGAAILLAGGIFFLNQSSEPQPTSNSTPSSTPTLQPVGEIPDDWQTYRNEEFGFEVKHPSGLTIARTDGKYADITMSDTKHSAYRFLTIDTRIDEGKSLLSWCNLQAREDFAKTYGAEKLDAEYYTLVSAGVIYSAEQFTLESGLNVILVKRDFNRPISSENEEIPRWGEGWDALMQGAEARYACLYGEGVDLAEEEFIQILSTFRFL